MFDTVPSTLLTIFLAFCVLWLVVQALRRIVRSRRGRREPVLEPVSESQRNEHGRTTPHPTHPLSTIPDAADVLALKAAIDNLARQVAALEKRLASGPTLVGPTQAPPPDRVIEPRPELSPVTPDHRI